ncbi:MAG: hypothetical protein DDT23_00876 [candidate division WS2 bacterium]|nr:hypothetical protein [Candidatus Lithacetigena glycinireducens]
MLELRFDPETHTYSLSNGQILPSVTQILQAEGLINYQGNNEWHMKRGKYLHQAIKLHLEDNLDRDNLDPQLEPFLQGFEKFLKDTGFKVEGFERPMYHNLHKFAGTPDLWGYLNGSMTVIDCKIGSFAPWHPIQLAAYMELLRVSGIIILSGMNLYLNNGKYNLKPVNARELQKGLSVFLSALTLQQWKKENYV